jgi:small nuclear ribonucleoprotein (snRNP)-like protein
MLGLINWRLKVTINDGRAFIGQMLAFDRHMNLVLADCEEFRHVRPKKKPGETEPAPEQEMKRSLGLVILRGETVVSLSVEGPPPVQDDDKKNAVRGDPFSPFSHIFGTPPLITTFPPSSCILAATWSRSWDASWTRNGNGASRCVLCSALNIFRSRMIVTHCGTISYRQRVVPHRLRDLRCHLRNLACQVRLLASVRLDSHKECRSPLLGSVALHLLGKTILRIL